MSEIYYIEIHWPVLCSHPFDTVYGVRNQNELWITRCNVRNVVGFMEDGRFSSISTGVLWFYICADSMEFFNPYKIYISIFCVWCPWDDMVVLYPRHDR